MPKTPPKRKTEKTQQRKGDLLQRTNIPNTNFTTKTKRNKSTTRILLQLPGVIGRGRSRVSSEGFCKFLLFVKEKTNRGEKERSGVGYKEKKGLEFLSTGFQRQTRDELIPNSVV